MSGRVIIDWVGIVALPIVAVAALLLLGGSADPCLGLAPNPSCRVHEGVSPLIVVIPAAVLWILAAADIVRAKRQR